jgi:hypothetical protein
MQQDGRASVRRAEIAQQLLTDPVMKDAFAAAEAAFTKEWREASDVTRRELAWAKVQGLEEVKRQLRVVINEGEALIAAKDRGSQ